MAKTIGNKIELRASEILYLNEELADVNFVFNNAGDVEKVPANKAILAALSPVFRVMFFGEMKKGGDVNIVDATADGFKEFLQFFYLDEVTPTMGNIKEVVKLADKYDMNRYVNNYSKYFDYQLTSDGDIFHSDTFLQFQQKNPRSEMSDCLQLIRFDAMKPEEFTSLHESYKKLFTTEKLIEVFSAIAKHEYESKHVNLKPRSKLQWNNNQKIKCIRSEQEWKPLKYGIQKVESISSQRKTLLIDKKTWGKRNADEICKWVTRHGLNNLKRHYDQIRGLPKPINEALWLRNSFDAVAMKHGLADVYYASEYPHYHLIGPNPSYYPFCDIEQGRNEWKNVRHKEEGFGLILWVVHPEQIEGTMFDEKNQKELIMESQKFDILIDEIENAPSNKERTKDQETIGSIRNRSNIPYFASLLDIKPEHLELVNVWKRDMVATLRNFGVSEENDNIRLYFHWPYSDDTVTLHLHARINQGSHPLEVEESITLNKVIEILKQGISIEEYILEKGLWYATTEDYHLLSQINGFTPEIVYNKFKLDNREVPNPSYKK